MYRKVMMFFAIVGVSLSLVLGLFSVITWELVAILIAVSLGIPTLIITLVNVKPEEVREQEQEAIAEEKYVLREETIKISPYGAYTYDFILKRGDTLKGKISSNCRIDIYFVNRTNFKKWDKEKNFDSEYCNESVLKTKIDYEVPKRGTWYLLIENNGRKTAIVEVYLY